MSTILSRSSQRPSKTTGLLLALAALLFPAPVLTRATERDYAMGYAACWDQAYADAKDGRWQLESIKGPADAVQGCKDGYQDAMDKIIKGTQDPEPVKLIAFNH